MAAQYTTDYAGGVILVFLTNTHSVFIVSGVDLAGCTFWGGSWLSSHYCVLFMPYTRQMEYLFLCRFIFLSVHFNEAPMWY